MMGQPNRGGTPRAERSKPNWSALRRAMGYNRHYGKIMLIAYGTLIIATLAQLAVPALVQTANGLETAAGRPHVLIARTTFGKGVSYMEGQVKWHYWPMSDSEYQEALAEVDAGA